ncbi:major facilitator superfamily domain-containing protein [Coniella lustricola]|uniref:Major facilitator superfamily domain-containing protein n=1 Tax=Coniella lustricola TaxID=2025994 RepID=A0A2T3A4Z5_9PEZI|nr:major facilitator superfamily domain-containing protein [Coniella lustricola]
MFLAYRFARRKYKEHQAAKASEQHQYQPQLDQDGAAQQQQQQQQGEAQHEGASTSGQKAAAIDYSVQQRVSEPATTETTFKESKVTVLTPEEKVDKKRRMVYRLKVVFGLSMPFMLQALDTTIVAAALPTIAAEFNSVSQQNWVISSFNLTAAAFLPFWAQAADIFGRHFAIQATIILMLIGSAICTGAPTSAFPALLVGRALQGVGCAGVNICVRTILADKVSLADYSLNWSLFAIISAVGYTIGPIVGGYLTVSSWRWCFAINLPVAVVAIVAVVFILRSELLGPQPLPELQEFEGRNERGDRRARLLVRLGTIDFVGQLLFLFGLGLFILALTWAGTGSAGTYRWGSAQVLAPLIVGALLTVVWFAYEYSMTPGRAMARVFPRQRPMMPWVLFQKKDISILFVVNFCNGMCLYAVMYFMDYYFQYVRGQSASDAGTSLLYFLPGLAAGAYGSMFMLNRVPRQTIYPLLLGSLSAAAAITVLAIAIEKNNINLVYGMMALAGFGVGSRMSPSTTHGLAHFPGSTAQITCVFAFAQPFGGAVGMTLMSAVWNNKLGHYDDFAKSAITYSYYAIIPFMWLCVIACLFLGNVWILKSGGHEIVTGVYFWGAIRGSNVKETRIRGGDHDWATKQPEGEQVAGASEHKKRGNAGEQV